MRQDNENARAFKNLGFALGFLFSFSVFCTIFSLVIFFLGKVSSASGFFYLITALAALVAFGALLRRCLG
jgi:uncharacterized membrane protein YuzA (DUF378 family)